MAKKRSETARDGNILFASDEANEATDTQTNQRRSNPVETSQAQKENNFLSSLGRGERLAVIAVCLLLVVGALGATGFGERILSTFGSKGSSQKTNQSSLTGQSAKNISMLASLNPFASAPSPDPTPQLSKEYIYAGSRMVAVEDTLASALPPADLGVWRPSNGTWYVLNSSNQQWTTQQWGQSGDQPVPGDYDGDGRTDFSVFRPSSDTWYVVSSSTGATIGYPFGSSGDIPAPADYDGDGKTDAAVFRPSNGNWYIVYSSNSSVVTLNLGTTGDKPAPGDFDGDGKADIAVWRGSDLSFHVKRTSDATNTDVVTQLGSSASDAPVVGDYDGDGKADFAVRHGADWITKLSSTNRTSTVTWQSAGDLAVQNDYDGDGKVDIAVWRDSTGMWYIKNSRDSTTRTVQWGSSGDTPVPAFYRR